MHFLLTRLFSTFFSVFVFLVSLNIVKPLAAQSSFSCKRAWILGSFQVRFGLKFIARRTYNLGVSPGCRSTVTIQERHIYIYIQVYTVFALLLEFSDHYVEFLFTLLTRSRVTCNVTGARNGRSRDWFECAKG